MTTTGPKSPTPSNDPLAGLRAWQAEEAKLEAQFAALQAQLPKDQAAITAAEAALANSPLNQQLQALEEEDYILKSLGVSCPGLDAQIAALKEEVQPLQDAITNAQNALDADTKALSDWKATQGKYISDGNNSAAGNSAAEAQMNQTVAQQNAASTKAALQNTEQQSGQNQVEADRESAMQSVSDMLALENATAADAILRIGNITQDQKDIDADQAREKVLKDRIIKDSIELAAFSIFACIGGVASDLRDAVNELGDAEHDESNKKADMVTQQADLKADLNTLQKLEVGDLTNLIDSLFATIGKLVALLGTDGKVSEGGMQAASALIAEVMSIVQMITAKVHQMRSEDQQWMSRGNIADSEIAANKSQVQEESLAALQEFAAFMKTVMTAVQIVGDVAAVAVAVISGGALAIFMAMLMIALTTSGAFNKMTQALADKMSSSGAVWAKVLADVIVAIATVVVTHSAAAGTAGLQSLTASAEEVEQEVAAEVEIEMTDLSDSATQSAKNEAAEAANEPVPTEAPVKPLTVQETSVGVKQGEATASKETVEASKFAKFLNTFKETFVENMSKGKQVAGMTTLFAGSTNTIVDLSEFIYAAQEKKFNASEADLSKDEAFQILKIVAAVVQAVIMMVGAKYSAGTAEGDTPLMEQLFGKIDALPKATSAINLVQNVSMTMGAGATASLAATSAFKGQLTEQMGKAQSELVTTQALGQQAKLFEEKEIELFASKLEQQIAALSMMIKKNGQAENEAAKVLEQSAV